MGAPPAPAGAYSSLVGAVFLFNLMVGAGSLTLPHAVSLVGLPLGVATLVVLGAMSYLAAAFTLEVLACTNAVLREEGRLRPAVGDKAVAEGREIELAERALNPFTAGEREEGEEGEDSTLLGGQPPEGADADPFRFSQRIEMDALAIELLGAGSKLRLLFSLFLVCYLFGDLAIYAVAVPKTVRGLVCPPPELMPDEAWSCFGGALDSAELYQALVALFLGTIGALTFFDVGETRALQLSTMLVRFLAVFTMIGIAVAQASKATPGEAHSSVQHPSQFTSEHWAALPTLFGVALYSFMCHHSIGAILVPVRPAEGGCEPASRWRVFAFVYPTVFVVYVALCSTAVIAFDADKIEDVYTMNFATIRVVGVLLSIFPILTLSSNFPIIAITLRENLRAMMAPCLKRLQLSDAGQVRLVAALVLAPCMAIALSTENVAWLVGITGTYAGVGIQWVMPACLVIAARERVQSSPTLRNVPNPYRSRLATPRAPQLMQAWALLALIVASFAHGAT